MTWLFYPQDLSWLTTETRKMIATDRSTSYLVRLRDRSTGQTFEASFNSMTERNLYIFETEHWAEVESEWTR